MNMRAAAVRVSFPFILGVAVGVTTGVAGAATVNCTGGTCFGTGSADTINGSGGDDTIAAGDGGDTVFGNGGKDLIFGEQVADDLGEAPVTTAA